MCKDYADDMWESQIDLLGSLSLATVGPDHLYAEMLPAGGGQRLPYIGLRQRWAGTVQQDSDFRLFPFDDQNVTLRFRSQHHGPAG
jgi:hypothetical protein